MGKSDIEPKSGTGPAHIKEVLADLGGFAFQPSPKKTAQMWRFSKPRVLIPTGLGINSHVELGWCFERAGADVDYLHWNKLITRPELLDKYQGLGLAGGFAMGDQLGAGQSLANRIYHSGLAKKLKEKIDDPKFITYEVCNSLQLCAKLNLMPFQVGTVQNDSGKHETTSWDLEINTSNDSVWLSYVKECTDPIFAPASHGEGNIYVPNHTIQTVNDNKYVALKYVKGHMAEFYTSSRKGRYNLNGSTNDIGGFAWNGNLALFLHLERLRLNSQREDKDIVPKKLWNQPYEPTYLFFKAAVNEMKKH